MRAAGATALAVLAGLALAGIVAVGYGWFAVAFLFATMLALLGATVRASALVSQLAAAYMVALFAAGKALSEVGVPLRHFRFYVGEFVLAVLLTGWLVLRARRVVGPSLRDPLSWFTGGLFLLGIAKALAFGFQTDDYGLRQLAMLAYIGWVPLGYLIAQTPTRLRTALWVMSLASMSLVLVGLLRLSQGDVAEITTTGDPRYLPGYAGLYSTIALAVALNVSPPHWLRPARLYRIVLAASVTICLVLAQHRSTFLAAGLVLLLSARNTLRTNRRFLAAGLALSLLALVLTVGLATSARIRNAVADLAVNRLASITKLDDPNTAWRLAAAAEVASVVVREPLGVGFRFQPFSFNLGDPYVASHNSYVDFALRFGIDGLILAVAIFSAVFVRLRRIAAPPFRDQTARALSAALVAVGLVAAFNVVFLTPYMGPLPWFLLGAGWGHLACPGAPWNRTASSSVATLDG
jgi:hypothetical protein